MDVGPWIFKGPKVTGAELAFMQANSRHRLYLSTLSLKERSASCECQRHMWASATVYALQCELELVTRTLVRTLAPVQSPTLPWPGNISHNPNTPLDPFHLLEMDREQWCLHGQSLNIHLCTRLRPVPGVMGILWGLRLKGDSI